MRVRNFNKFQHFKDRRPPWIKLYRDLLDDVEWFELDDKSSKTLVMLWLIASEDHTSEGQLPDVKTLAFRLRIKESELKQRLTKLDKWLIHDDISVISGRYQDGLPETETETETETDRGVRFQDFWSLYPKKKDKAAAERAWTKLKPEVRRLALAALPNFQFDEREGGQFIKHPATWLNAGSWQDDEISESAEAYAR